MSSTGPYVDYMEQILRINDSLSKDEFKKLLQFAGNKITKKQREEIKDLNDVVELLIERNLIKTPDDDDESENGESQFLIGILDSIKRNDLARELKSFHEKLASKRKGRLENIQKQNSVPNLQQNQNSSIQMDERLINSKSMSSNGDIPGIFDDIDAKEDSGAPKSLSDELGYRNEKIKLSLDTTSNNTLSSIQHEYDATISVDEPISSLKIKKDIDRIQTSKFVVNKRDPESYIIQDFDEEKTFNPSNYSDDSTFLNEKQIDALNLNLKLRNYQIELANLGLHGFNSIICLKTGGGKTIIAALIVKYLHLKHKLKLNKRFKTVFIVPTRLLVIQQLQLYNNIFGDESVYFELKGLEEDETFEDYIGQVDILFCTPQKLVNCLKSSIINFKLTDIDLLVFDECHHAIKNHPYNDIMKFYHKTNYELKISSDFESKIKMPQVIGLTASIGCGDLKRAFEHLIQLCANLDAIHLSFVQKYIDELNAIVPSSHSYKIYAFKKSLPDTFSFNLRHIMELIENKANLQIRKPYGTSLYMQCLVEAFKDSKITGNRDKIIANEYLSILNTALMNYEDIAFQQTYELLAGELKLKRLKNPIEIESYIYELLDKKIFDVFETKTEEQLIKDCIINDYNEKLKKLVSIILEHVNYNRSAMGLVFVPQRVHAMAIQKFIENHPETKHLIRSSYLMGKAKNQKNEVTDENISDTQQKIVLETFRNKAYNLLVVTSIAAEGVDLPDCNYVIRYDFVSDEIGFIQIRGRARMRDSFYHIITYENSLLLRNEQKNKILEKEMEEALNRRMQMTAGEFEILVKQYQSALVKRILNEEEEKLKEKNDLKTFEIHCAKCNEYLCKSNSIKKRVQHFITIDEDFIKTKITFNPGEIRVFKTEKHIGKILCKNPTCGNKLGTKLEFITGSLPYGYSLSIDSIKFKEADNELFVIYKKWKDIEFEVEELLF